MGGVDAQFDIQQKPTGEIQKGERQIVRIADVLGALERWEQDAYEKAVKSGATGHEATLLSLAFGVWAEQDGIYNLTTGQISIPEESHRK